MIGEIKVNVITKRRILFWPALIIAVAATKLGVSPKKAFGLVAKVGINTTLADA